jgi:hypothetical protein
MVVGKVGFHIGWRRQAGIRAAGTVRLTTKLTATSVTLGAVDKAAP